MLMNKELTIGFLGFGEAGSHIAKGLKSAGCSRLTAFDIAPEKVKDHAAEAGVPLTASNRELADSARLIFSTVTCACAKEAAGQTAPYLQTHHIYADLNSVSPLLKQEIERTISATGAGFVEAAVMSPVPPYGHRAPMLLGGKAGTSFLELMAPFGMRLEVLSDKVGVAAAAKMFRSIIVKGL